MSNNIINNFSIQYNENLSFNFKEGWEPLLAFYQTCETETKRYFASIIKEDWNVIDVGANIGMFSALFAQVTKGDVFLIEAAEINMNMLKNNLEVFSNVYYLKEYLSSQVEEKEGTVHYLWTGHGSQLREVGLFNTNTIDNIFANNASKINLIKIDIDGWDFPCLLGAKEIINKHKPIVMVEVMDETLQLTGNKTQDVFDFFDSLNYKNVTILDKTNYIFESK
jgi:FkbM family methyltransferase